MEVVHGRRERYMEEEEVEASKHPSSSSSSSTCWISISQGESAAAHVEREHMFDKVVTPSDVGKLNRLVIPKQHAQKYFPLDPASGDKGLLLCFEEDGTGKPWRFRYSYWNSSQSYVMTKGWSRFVKEKRLDAGDTVSFARGVGDSGQDRLFIDWRRRPPDLHRSSLPAAHPMMPLRSVVVPWVGGRPWPPPPVSMYGGSSSSGGAGQCRYFRSLAQGGSGGGPMVLDSVPVGRGKAEPKRLRLFGVNMECSEPDPDQQRPPPNPHQWRLGPPRSEFS